MATPRHQLVDPNNPLFYHVVSRCVRRSWLCGFDFRTRRNYNYRKAWLVERLNQLGSAFAVDVYAYAIMSNHFHLVLYLDPTAPNRWSDEEVAERWLRITPPTLGDGSVDEGLLELQKELLLDDPDRLIQLRSNLASLSVFMKLLKQPIARRANLEDGCTGHFFEQRFYSGALLSESAVLAAMAYVDLNPIRAKIARTIEAAKHTSIHARLHSDGQDLAAYIGPIVDGIGAAPPFEVRLSEYVEQLRRLTLQAQPGDESSKIRRWRDQVFSLRKRQRVYGPESLIKAWAAERGWQLRELPCLGSWQICARNPARLSGRTLDANRFYP